MADPLWSLAVCCLGAPGECRWPVGFGWQLERSILDTCHKAYDVDGVELTRGTLRDVLTEAKRRGMLG